MTAKQFEDLKVWQAARLLVKAIYRLTSSAKFTKDYSLKDQIQRASVSIMNNIAEGFERDNNNEFVRFLNYSKGSAGEVRSLFYVAIDLEYITQCEFDSNYEACLKLIKQLASLIKYLKSNS
ncbi:MAG: four helix bundle protein [Ignavibacteria bacterium]|jgi:four helix bundle protein